MAADDEVKTEIEEVVEADILSTSTKRKRTLKGRLTGARYYLAGPIDYAKDDGVGWRRDMTEYLSGFGSVVLDPTDKPTSQCKYNEVGDEKALIKKLVKLERWDELRDLAKSIALVDLRMVEVSDFLVAYVNTKLHLCGTYDEIFQSLNQRKPTYVVIEGGKAAMPLWLRAKLNHNFVFGSFEELKDYLYALHTGVVEPDYTRWVFFDTMGE